MLSKEPRVLTRLLNSSQLRWQSPRPATFNGKALTIQVLDTFKKTKQKKGPMSCALADLAAQGGPAPCEAGGFNVLAVQCMFLVRKAGWGHVVNINTDNVEQIL